VRQVRACDMYRAGPGLPLTGLRVADLPAHVLATGPLIARVMSRRTRGTSEFVSQDLKKFIEMPPLDFAF
jgi:hypothetical protein